MNSLLEPSEKLATLSVAAVQQLAESAPIVTEPDDNNNNDDDKYEYDDEPQQDDERCSSFDWNKVSSTTPRTGYIYAGCCEYSVNNALCFLCLAPLKFAHVMQHPQRGRALVGANCLQRLLADGGATNRSSIQPTYLNRMLYLLSGPWTNVAHNELSICKRFRAGSAWSHALVPGGVQGVEIRCGINRNDPTQTWAAFRVVGKHGSMTFFDDVRFPQRQQVCAVAFSAENSQPKERKQSSSSASKKSYFRSKQFLRRKAAARYRYAPY